MVPVHSAKEFWLTFSYTHVQTRQAEIKAKNPAAWPDPLNSFPVRVGDEVNEVDKAEILIWIRVEHRSLLAVTVCEFWASWW